MEGNKAYFRRRAREETEAALKAAHPAARDAHIELASRLDEAASGEAEPMATTAESEKAI